jgi:hypothetical protein
VVNDKHQQLRVRIAAIDAPERQQPFAARSWDHLSNLVRRQTVVVQWHKKDQYGSGDGLAGLLACGRTRHLSSAQALLAEVLHAMRDIRSRKCPPIKYSAATWKKSVELLDAAQR